TEIDLGGADDNRLAVAEIDATVVLENPTTAIVTVAPPHLVENEVIVEEGSSPQAPSDATGVLISPPGEFSLVSKDPDGGWIRRMKDGTVHHFDLRGYLE